MSGWGLLNETDSQASNILQYVDLPVLTWNQCNDAYGNFVEMTENGQFCAGNRRGQDACAGDSGGPYQVKKTTIFREITLASKHSVEIL